jgi:hypothetical protein
MGAKERSGSGKSSIEKSPARAPDIEDSTLATHGTPAKI